MTNNKLFVAALAGLLAATSPIAAMAEHDSEGKEANACKGEANKCPTATEGKASESEKKAEETKAEDKKAEEKK